MLIDSYDREVRYLRISVTQRCNFRCQYCMPEKPFEWVHKEDILSFEELFKFVKLAIDEGITKIRITGGEPLLRHDLDRFIKMIATYSPDIDLALTTNGYLLHDCAQALKKAGLKRVNISLDSLDKATVHKIAQKDVLQDVLRGIDKALSCGLVLKLNMVPLRGINDHEILPMLQYCKERKITVRFIEYMQNKAAKTDLVGLKSCEILKLIEDKHSVEDLGLKRGSPSHRYLLDGEYEFGIIEPHEDDFCKSCDRIRLDAEGYLIPCLYFDEAKSLRPMIKANDMDGVKHILHSVIEDKPEKNRFSSSEVSSRAFYETGG